MDLLVAVGVIVAFVVIMVGGYIVVSRISSSRSDAKARKDDGS